MSNKDGDDGSTGSKRDFAFLDNYMKEQVIIAFTAVVTLSLGESFGGWCPH